MSKIVHLLPSGNDGNFCGLQQSATTLLIVKRLTARLVSLKKFLWEIPNLALGSPDGCLAERFENRHRRGRLIVMLHRQAATMRYPLGDVINVEFG